MAKFVVLVALLLCFGLFADCSDAASGGGAAGGAAAGAAHQQASEMSPAERRNRRDTLCHDIGDGKERCTSVQCDPKYGWCTQCAYEILKPVEPTTTGEPASASPSPSHEAETTVPPIPGMNCQWVQIKGYSTDANGAHSIGSQKMTFAFTFALTLICLGLFY